MQKMCDVCSDSLCSNIVREDRLFSCCWPESSPWLFSIGPPGAPSAAPPSARVACRAGERGGGRQHVLVFEEFSS